MGAYTSKKQSETIIMNRPGKFLARMILFLVIVGGIIAVLYQPIKNAFMANPPLNGLIAGVIVTGILLNLRHVFMLSPEIAWIDRFREDRTALSGAAAPQLLSPVAQMANEQKNRKEFFLSAIAARSLMDSIASRLEESRDTSRYFIGLSIFLGLLGTFWGLMETVGSIGTVINNLSVSGENAAEVFNDLQKGLELPLKGMGTAFSSSLLGLSGSLVVGFLDLQAGQAQNNFYNELDDWLTSLTHKSPASSASADGDQSANAYVHALLEQTMESVDQLRRILSKSEEEKISTNNQIQSLTETLTNLAEQMHKEQRVISKMGENQLILNSVLAELADNTRDSIDIQKEVRNHIRSVDTGITRLNVDIGAGREETTKDIRNEIKLLARTISSATDKSKS